MHVSTNSTTRGGGSSSMRGRNMSYPNTGSSTNAGNGNSSSSSRSARPTAPALQHRPQPPPQPLPYKNNNNNHHFYEQQQQQQQGMRPTAGRDSPTLLHPQSQSSYTMHQQRHPYQQPRSSSSSSSSSPGPYVMNHDDMNVASLYTGTAVSQATVTATGGGGGNNNTGDDWAVFSSGRAAGGGMTIRPATTSTTSIPTTTMTGITNSSSIGSSSSSMTQRRSPTPPPRIHRFIPTTSNDVELNPNEFGALQFVPAFVDEIPSPPLPPPPASSTTPWYTEQTTPAVVGNAYHQHRQQQQQQQQQGHSARTANNARVNHNNYVNSSSNNDNNKDRKSFDPTWDAILHEEKKEASSVVDQPQLEGSSRHCTPTSWSTPLMSSQRFNSSSKKNTSGTGSSTGAGGVLHGASNNHNSNSSRSHNSHNAPRGSQSAVNPSYSSRMARIASLFSSRAVVKVDQSQGSMPMPPPQQQQQQQQPRARTNPTTAATTTGTAPSPLLPSSSTGSINPAPVGAGVARNSSYPMTGSSSSSNTTAAPVLPHYHPPPAHNTINNIPSSPTGTSSSSGYVQWPGTQDRSGAITKLALQSSGSFDEVASGNSSGHHHQQQQPPPTHKHHQRRPSDGNNNSNGGPLTTTAEHDDHTTNLQEAATREMMSRWTGAHRTLPQVVAKQQQPHLPPNPRSTTISADDLQKFRPTGVVSPDGVGGAAFPPLLVSPKSSFSSHSTSSGRGAHHHLEVVDAGGGAGGRATTGNDGTMIPSSSSHLLDHLNPSSEFYLAADGTALGGGRLDMSALQYSTQSGLRAPEQQHQQHEHIRPPQLGHRSYSSSSSSRSSSHAGSRGPYSGTVDAAATSAPAPATKSVPYPESGGGDGKTMGKPGHNNTYREPWSTTAGRTTPITVPLSSSSSSSTAAAVKSKGFPSAYSGQRGAEGLIFPDLNAREAPGHFLSSSSHLSYGAYNADLRRRLTPPPQLHAPNEDDDDIIMIEARPPTEETLAVQDKLSPPHRSLGAKGYRGLIEKTKDVPSLMDGIDSDSMTSSRGTSTYSAAGPPPPTGRNSASVGGRSDSESDVFDGISVAKESDVFDNLSNVDNKSPGRRARMAAKEAQYPERIAEEEEGGTAGGGVVGTSDRANNDFKVVLLGGGLTAIQPTAEGFSNRKTASDFDENLTNSDTDPHGFHRIPGFHEMMSAGRTQKDSSLSGLHGNLLDPDPSPNKGRVSLSREELTSTESEGGGDASSLFTDPYRHDQEPSDRYYDDDDYVEGDLSEYAVEPKQMKKLLHRYRILSEKIDHHKSLADFEKDEDEHKAFALFEMRSRIMAKDIERGLERRGGTVVVDDIVTTPYHRTAHRIRDAVIVSKAWRDGASPKDVVNTALLTRRAEHTYYVRRKVKSGNNVSDSMSVSSLASGSSRKYRWEAVKWTDDTDFVRYRCPSLGPRHMRGFEMFTIGDCQSILLKLTNDRCTELRHELNNATRRQIEAEDLLKHEDDGFSGLMTDAEMIYLRAMEEVKAVSKKLVTTEQAFTLVRDRIRQLVNRYEAMLIRIENESIAGDSSVVTYESSYYSEYDYEYWEEHENRERALWARRAKRAEVRAELAAREALMTKQEARMFQEEKQHELEALQQKLLELQSETSTNITEKEQSARLAGGYTRRDVNPLTEEEPARPAIDQERLEGVKQRFRDRIAAKKRQQATSNPSSLRTPVATSTPTSINTSNGNNSYIQRRPVTPSPEMARKDLIRSAGEEMFQQMDFYERSLKAVELARDHSKG